jgi:predicted MFS family arabinose efflux permease
LLFFYIGFIAGSVFCGLSDTYAELLAARIITGLFGGVIGSISMAIITDLFNLQHRGRVMGFIQLGFGASQVLGIPIGLYIANLWGWQSPFLMVAGMAIIVAVFIFIKLRPLTKHLAVQKDKTALMHLLHTVSKRNYRIGFISTALLSVGGFMMMPFGTAFSINNLHITQQLLPMLFMVAGVSSLFIMPVIGKLSDRFDKYTIFAAASVWMMVMVVLYTNLSVTPFWLVIIFNILMMMGIMSRMVPASALTSAIPEMRDRGAFMSINASLQQIAGGIAAAFAGMIVTQKSKFSPLEHYNTLGYVIVCLSVISVILMYRVSVLVKKKTGEQKNVPVKEEVVLSEM